MSKRIILELVYPGSRVSGGDGQGRQQQGQLPGIGKASGIVQNQKMKDLISNLGQSARKMEGIDESFVNMAKTVSEPYVDDKYRYYPGSPLAKKQTLQFADIAAKREMGKAVDKAMEFVPGINRQYQEEALKAQVTAVKSSLKSINQKMAPILHYSTQAFALYHKNQMNTFQMSGMTSAAIRQQQFAQGLSLAQELTTTSIAFMINPVLGAVQLAMSAINRVADYQERSRVFEYNKAKDEYSANYYRNRLVNNMRVVI